LATIAVRWSLGRRFERHPLQESHATLSLPLLRLSMIVTLTNSLFAAIAFADDLVGRATVVDGDTIEIHCERIRLWGIDAPEGEQLCRNDESDLYPCGRQAAVSLAALFYAIPRPVTCSPNGQDQYGRTIAVCLLGVPGPDLGRWPVANGHALDWPKYSQGRYEDAQSGAEKADGECGQAALLSPGVTAPAFTWVGGSPVAGMIQSKHRIDEAKPTLQVCTELQPSQSAFSGRSLERNVRHTQFGTLVLPRQATQTSKINGLRNRLGKNGFIALQGISREPPKQSPTHPSLPGHDRRESQEEDQ
jgi:endonuclease YncB( thermonuclease family)